MISVFLSKLLTSRQANFTEENISIFDLPFAMQPLETLVELQKTLEEKYGKEGTELIVDFGRSISNSILKHFKTRFDMRGKQLRDIWLNMFSLGGFGKLEIIEFGFDSAILQADNSTIAKIYLSKYKKSKTPVCLVIKGMLEIFFQEITGKRAGCKETSCLAQGKKYCTFELKTKI